MFVQGLPWAATEEEVREFFQSCGDMESVRFFFETRVMVAFGAIRITCTCLASLPACLGACPPACLSACLRACVRVCVPELRGHGVGQCLPA